jgi:hypothetical protein
MTCGFEILQVNETLQLEIGENSSEIFLCNFLKQKLKYKINYLTIYLFNVIKMQN